MPIPKPLFLQIFLDCDVLAEPASQEDLPIASFTNGLDNLDLVFGDEES